MRRRHKLFSLVLALIIIISLCACGDSNASNETVEYADQKAFLEAMAKGIQSRLDNVDDAKHVNDTDEQKADYYKTLVRCELDQIEKYEVATFADSRFNDLAHHYIHACQMQYSGAENIKNTQLHTALWSGGATIRGGIIVTMYEQYDLPINSTTVANYTGATGGTYNITFGAGSNSTKGEFDKDAVIDKLSVSYEMTQNDSDVVFLENTSDEIVDVTLTIKLYDNGKLVSSENALFWNVLPGQMAANRVFLRNVVYNNVEVEFSKVSRGYLQIADGVKLEDLISFSITTTTDNAIIECSNIGLDPSAIIQSVVVFYRNGMPVWCEGTWTSFNVDIGQSQSKKALELLSVTVPFDDVKVYVYSIQKTT